MLTTKTKGDKAEKKAIAFLKKEGFKIIEQNYFAKKMGEIDIIATKKDVYHFIEVKSGYGFDPIYNITPSKLNKVIKSTQLYLKQHALDVHFSIDALIVREEAIEYLENITL